VKLGVELTDGRLGAVRLDSGDLGVLASQVRELLDSLGATDTKIIVTSDLDEFTIAALSGAPVDGYGVGTPWSPAAGTRPAASSTSLSPGPNPTSRMRR
jgi:nicotinate phosphoribosyltransferase